LARQLAEEMLSVAASLDTCTSYTPICDHAPHHIKGTFISVFNHVLCLGTNYLSIM